MSEEQSFESWLQSTQKQRDALFDYAKSEMPTSPELIGADIDKAIRAEQAAGLQAIDAEYFLTGETAKAVLKYKEPDQENKGYSATERNIMVKLEVREIVRLRDRLELLKQIFSARRINGFGSRKSQQQ